MASCSGERELLIEEVSAILKVAWERHTLELWRVSNTLHPIFSIQGNDNYVFGLQGTLKTGSYVD